MEHDFSGRFGGKLPGATESLISCSISSKPSLIPVSAFRGRFRLHFRGMRWRAKSSLCRQPFKSVRYFSLAISYRENVASTRSVLGQRVVNHTYSIKLIQ